MVTLANWLIEYPNKWCLNKLQIVFAKLTEFIVAPIQMRWQKGLCQRQRRTLKLSDQNLPGRKLPMQEWQLHSGHFHLRRHQRLWRLIRWLEIFAVLSGFMWEIPSNFNWSSVNLSHKKWHFYGKIFRTMIIWNFYCLRPKAKDPGITRVVVLVLVGLCLFNFHQRATPNCFKYFSYCCLWLINFLSHHEIRSFLNSDEICRGD